MQDKPILYSITKKDFVIETMRGSGKGGQKRNKTDTAVRITHPPSKAVSYCDDERSQLQNKKRAFDKLVHSEVFQKWFKIENAKRQGRIIDIEKLVDEMMREENLKIEYYNPE